MRRRLSYGLLLLGLVCLNMVNTFSTPQFTVEVAKNLKLSWSFVDSSIVLIVEKTSVGHAAIGLGTSMKDGDIVQIETANGVLSVQDCKLVGKVFPSCSENQDWTVVDKSLTSNGFKVELTRSAQASEGGDKSYSKSVQSVIYSHTPSPYIENHSGPGVDGIFGTVNVDFEKGILIKGPLGNKYFKHEHTQALLWTIGIDILIFIGRFMQKYNRFFDAHSWPSLAILIASIVLRDHGEGGATDKVGLKGFHEALSIVLIVFSALILLNGLGLRFILEFDKKPFKVHDLTLIRRVHLTLGIITWIIARVIVFTGTIMFKSTFGPLFLILVIIETVLFLLIIIGMTVLKKLKKKSWVEKVKEDFKAKQEAADHHQEMLRDIRSRMSVEQLSAKYPKRNVMLYLNKVIDMDSYIHPGGQFLFEECRWKEISRYITGAAGLERFNGMRWIHSHTTFDLMKKHAIGDLVDTVPTYDSLVLRDTNKAQVLSNFSEIWKVSKSVQISPTTSIIQFVCDPIVNQPSWRRVSHEYSSGGSQK